LTKQIGGGDWILQKKEGKGLNACKMLSQKLCCKKNETPQCYDDIRHNQLMPNQSKKAGAARKEAMLKNCVHEVKVCRSQTDEKTEESLEAGGHVPFVNVSAGAALLWVIDCMDNGAVAAVCTVGHLHWFCAAIGAHAECRRVDAVEA